VGGDVAGEEFEARGEAHDEEKKLDEAALVATAAAAKRNLPPIWPPGSREGNVAKWDACRRVLDEAELAADLAEAGLYSNTKPRGRGTRNRAAAELHRRPRRKSGHSTAACSGRGRPPRGNRRQAPGTSTTWSSGTSTT